jgi:hypothetical protein
MPRRLLKLRGERNVPIGILAVGCVARERLTYHVEHHVRQKYRCACNGAVVTAPPPRK